MSLSEFSIKRPVFVSMLILVVLVLGFIALSRLPVDLMPDITYPTLNVSTSYPNTAPEEMEQIITRPIEEALSSVPGVEEIFSVSSQGGSTVRVMFKWGTNIDEAANEIRERIDRIIGRFPEEVQRPTLRKFDPAQSPILTIGILTELDPLQVRRIIDEQISYRLERVPGVASVDVWGGLEREIQVNIFPDKVKALGLPLDLIISKIRQENVDIPAGTIEKGNYEITVRIPGVYTNIDQIKETIVAVRDGGVIRIKDIANVEDTNRRVTRIARVDNLPSISLSIYKQSGENTVNVVDGVYKELEYVKQDYPQFRFIVLRDNAKYVRDAINNVGTSALYGGLLAVLVLLFFLVNLRSTLVIALSIPISIIATFTLMYFGGFTLNVMSLGGLALGIGMMVDNSIVVLENIFRMREEGVPLQKAAVDGATEVTSAIIASTVTTVIVFLPMLFVEGASGIMFKQLAYVVAFSLACSLIVALTLVPMLASKILKGDNIGNHNPEKKLAVKSKKIFSDMENGYKKLLDYCLHHRVKVLLITGALLLVSVILFRFIGQEYMPQTDEGEVRITVEMEVGTRLSVMDQKLREVVNMAKQLVPEIESIEERAGSGGWRGGANRGNITLKLVPKAKRNRSSMDIAADLSRQLSNVPGAIIRTRATGGQMMMGMRGGGGQERLQIEIRGYDLEIGQSLAQEVKRVVEKIKGVTDVSISRVEGTPEDRLVIDRQKASEMKLSVNQIGTFISTILSGSQASQFREAGREYRILVKVKDSERLDVNDLLDLTITNSDGEQVSLRNVIEVQSGRGPQQIERRDRERIINVSGEIADRDLGSVIRDAQRAIKTIPRPANFAIGFTGDYEEQQKANRELMISIILALFMVYMVMAMLYESLRDPLIVMFSVPLTVIGVAFILLLTGTSINVQAYIGMIMLGGIVVNNAILLVDYTNLLRRRDGFELMEAIKEAGRRRLRPILMTALTTILGMLPLALGIGEGSEVQTPLARVVIGGLTSSTFITLVVIPVVYSLFEQIREKRANNNHTS
ncbi:MAG TPA: efflux RND transporter permease subunit [Candidatus Saccharicenans sp.]|jgi:HAE1 family hydrophobic/amphiphilic exporter-1|nr:efflux RND transporter permease subunit [Candidatus Saccharicenans sp.]HRD01071.1 efflux RND transporter permease subunit [Candidatus Saccharicenans sp.]